MRFKVFMKKYWIYAVAFLLPIVVVIVNCLIRDSWLLGNGSILTGDAGNQYIYLYEELWNKVHSGDFSFFSWNAAGGFDFYLNLLYYMISPATLFILILPKSCLEDALQFFMVLKWALLSCTSVCFFMNTRLNTLRKNKQLVSLTLGLSYAIGGFFICVLQFFNWMDTMILFPILLLLVERLVRDGRWKLYYILLTVAMFCNFYMAFSVCIFLLLWFVLQLQLVKKVDKSAYIKFFGSSVLSAISCMAVIMPSIMNVSDRYTAEHSDYVIYEGHLSLVELISRFFALSKPETGDVHFYISMEILVVAMLFCFVRMRPKIKFTMIMIFMFILISLFVEPLNLMWHGFAVPHGYSPRYAYVFAFMLDVMTLCVIERLRHVRIWHCICVLLAGVGLFCYAFFNISKYEDYYVYLITILAFVFCLILLVLLSRRSIKKKSFLVLFCLLSIVELTADAYQKMDNYNVPKPENRSYVEETYEMASKLSLNKGERLQFNDAEYNLGMSLGVPALSGYISYFNGGLGTLAYNLGIMISVDSGIKYVGGTPLLDLIFNIAYDIGISDTELINKSKCETEGDLTIYRNDQLAGFGYMVDSDILDWNCNNEVTYRLQNEFVKCATGVDSGELFNLCPINDIECTTPIGLLENENDTNGVFVYSYTPVYESDEMVMDFTVEKDMDLYLQLYASDKFYFAVEIDDQVVLEKYEDVVGMIIPIGKVKKGQKISIMCFVDEHSGEEIQISGIALELNKDVWQSAYNSLSESTYQISEMNSDYVSGTIEPDKDGIMMTSIPAMRGFDVFVDGKETEYKKIADALIGVPLEKGSHMVEFRYHTPYAGYGWIISLCGVAIFILIAGFESRMSNKM